MARCKECRSAALHDWVKRNPNYEKDRYSKNPAWHRERHLIRKYGVTQAEYELMFRAQAGMCAVCHKTQKRAFDVDHNHITKEVRGLLCTNCNRMIGHAGDNLEILEAAAAYLRRFVPALRTSK